MKPEEKSQLLLNITRAKAKMWEYNVPIENHITIPVSPEKLFPLTIALLGDVAAEINRGHENTESFKNLKEALLFSADYFNSLYETKLIETLSATLRLFASAAYYLCDMPGNADVLAKSLKYEDFEAGTEDLYIFLLRILREDTAPLKQLSTEKYAKYLRNITSTISDFYENGNAGDVEQELNKLRNVVYLEGTPEHLLLGDIIASVTRKKMENASVQILPKYTDINIEQWMPIVNKSTFIKEFWPAQHLLGKTGAFRGKSVVVQMPTSAGKTKSTELIIRSAFLSKRTNIAIIIAPFRALCHEIKDSLQEAFRGDNARINVLSDVLQNDFIVQEVFNTTTIPQVLVVTPEKLLYILRHYPIIATYLKLIIFDEGHQFDTGKRGIIYELLLTSLKQYISSDAQKILFSAVISNAEDISEWLNRDRAVLRGGNLIPTIKAIGFASWKDQMGQIKYMNGANDVFFVPRVIEQHILQKQGKERKQRMFPEKQNAQDIALFLGLKLCVNGGVAVFCGIKKTAVKICERVVEIIHRGYSIHNLQICSDENELLAISTLLERHFGKDSCEVMSSKIGIFPHHNNIPYGVRLAIEYAMREDKIRFVVCTSTLAQGVNLPIRYLIITSLYQGSEQIKVRDFHNLIGRAGRSGKHIEGSILFADPDVYDNKTNRYQNHGWKTAQKMLDVNNSEQCASSLLTLFEPISNQEQKRYIKFGESTESFEAVIDAYINNKIKELAVHISQKYNSNGFDYDTVFKQLFDKQLLIEALENFLLAHWEESDNPEEFAEELAKQTLAFYLADNKQRSKIIQTFRLLAKNISEKIPEQKRKSAFGKTLYGVNTGLSIENWVSQNKENLLSVTNIESFIEIIWPLFCEVIENNNNNRLFSKFDPQEARKSILLGWIAGQSFAELLVALKNNNVRKISGSQRRIFSVENIVDICENIFAFEGTLVIGAIQELLEANEDIDYPIKELLQVFQKRLKYGLPNVSAITVYELGFSDRVIAQEIASKLSNDECNKEMLLTFLKGTPLIDLQQLPLYYKKVYDVYHSPNFVSEEKR